MKMPIRLLIAVAGVLLVVGVLGTVKGLQIGRMVAHGKAFAPPAQTVTAATVDSAEWETTLTAAGSLEAVQGVMVAAELAGKVTRIAFEAGATVSAGQLLLQQEISEETARLRAAESRAVLARKDLSRAQTLFDQHVIPGADLDEQRARHDQAIAERDNIRAVIEKKTVRAPFTGRLGIRQVNLGEVLETGQPVVSLQSLDPIFVNFRLPQQMLERLKPGLIVRIGEDASRTAAIQGAITAINPEVDPATRNISLQATINNPQERLRPGMYVSVSVVLPVRRSVLAIPATAVVYAPYSDSVFVIENRDDESDRRQQILRQQFVQLGEKRGDFVAVRRGLEPGQTIVSTGVFKLRNGQAVVVDNALAPTFDLSPRPENS
jgi:membrane fusion protein (multidrug efflux system)